MYSKPVFEDSPSFGEWTVRPCTSMQGHPAPHSISFSACAVRTKARSLGDRLLMSFHGIPGSYSRSGDPYHGRCHLTARLLAEALERKPADWCLGFQSRMGKARWLRPYTDYLIEDLAAAGVKRLDVIAPGFSADCLETLEEIGMRYAELFRRHGGGELRYVPALNERPSHLAALAGIAGRHLAV